MRLHVINRSQFVLSWNSRIETSNYSLVQNYMTVYLQENGTLGIYNTF